MTMHRVFRPQVQSIARPLSLASCTSLFAGADSDAITATTRSALIILLNPTFTNFIGILSFCSFWDRGTRLRFFEIKASFVNKAAKKLPADQVSAHYGKCTGIIQSASGGFFLDGVQFGFSDNSLRVQFLIVLEGAMQNCSVQSIRKLLMSSQAPPRPCSP